MPLRTLFLRLMLWSLGLAAATGVLAVLFQGGDLVWRLVGTGLATGGACGLLIPASHMVDRERVRWAGLLGMGVVILEFLMALSLIWEVVQSLLPSVSVVEGKIILTMAFFALGVGVAMVCAEPLYVPRQAIAAGTALGLFTLGLIAFLVATWWSDLGGGSNDDWWWTGGALLVLGVLAASSLIGLSAANPRHWRWAGILASVVACAMWLIEIWRSIGSDLGFVVFCGLLSLGAVVAHANLCLIPNLRAGRHWVRHGTILFAMITAALIVLFIAKDKFQEIPINADLFGRFAAAGGIVAGCGTLALLVLARMNRKVDAEPESYELSEISLVCPRCRRKLSLPTGDSICPSCGLRISIRVEEPRCATCDYLLRELTSDRCPECGTPIASTVSTNDPSHKRNKPLV